MVRSSPATRWLVCPFNSILILLILCGLALGQDKKDSDEWKVPAFKTRTPNPSVPSAESIAAGKGFYQRECLTCHGASGLGDGPAAKDLEKHPGDLSSPKIWDRTDGALFFKITVGRRPMPSFRDKFTDDERWLIIDYIRTLTLKDSRPQFAAPASARHLVSDVLIGYFQAESRLVDGQFDAARQAAGKLSKPLEAMGSFDVSALPEAGRGQWTEVSGNLTTAQKAMESATDLAAARKAFGDLSFGLQVALRQFGHAEPKPVSLFQSQQVADHNSAMWLQAQDAVGDPYAGKDKQGRFVTNIHAEPGSGQ